MERQLLVLVIATLLSSCAVTPRSEGEKSSGFTYIPLDPLPVEVLPGPGCGVPDTAQLPASGLRYVDTLLALPDNAVRIAIREYDSKGTLSFGAGSIGTEGKRYQVILDYVNVDSSNIPFDILLITEQSARALPLGLRELSPSKARALNVERLTFEQLALRKKEALTKDEWVTLDRTETTRQRRLDALTGEPLGPDAVLDASVSRTTRHRVVIPVYVGVGLRLTADLQVIRGNINISSLGGIAAGVEAGRAAGSLVVQTLGITGPQVSTTLPLPSELNQTTVQNAILALGSIKAIVAADTSTVVTPRVSGLYLPIQNATDELVNRIVSELASAPIPWRRPCVAIASELPKGATPK